MSSVSNNRFSPIFKEHTLAHTLLDGHRGLEIGAASHNPFGLKSRNVAPPDDFELYADETRRIFGIEPAAVDIWAYAWRIPVPDASEDFIISSHVVEHLPDLIGSFIEWNRIVRDGGHIFIIAPIKGALAEDLPRELTPLEHFISDYKNRTTIDTHSTEGVPGGRLGHYHTFTPDTLLAVVDYMRAEGLCDWRLVEREDVDSKVGNGFTLVFQVGHEERPATAVNEQQPPAPLYDAFYYAHDCGQPYERTEEWLGFFQSVAESIVNKIRPATVLDAGCAMGFLVEALHDKGADASGIDLSEFAIANVRPDIQDRCQVGSITAPFPQHYDLITCIEVVEHLPPDEGERAIKNICDHTDDVLFASTPFDYEEATHLNVQPPDYWAEIFARYGFYRDLEFDASFLCGWAVRYRRSNEDTPRLVSAYERRLWQVDRERQAKQALGLKQMQRLAENERAINQLKQRVRELERQETTGFAWQQTRDREMRKLLTQADRLKKDQKWLEQGYRQASAAVTKAEAQLAEYERAMADILNSVSYSLGLAVWRLRLALAPRGSLRERVLKMPSRLIRSMLGLNSKKHVEAKAEAQGSEQALTEAPVAESAEDAYQAWIARTEPGEAQLEDQRHIASGFAYRPLISIVTPVYNTPPEFLRAMVESVLSQTYDHWELCLVDGSSTSLELKQQLQAYARRDERIRVKYLTRNLGISGNSNEGLALAKGDFIALLDHDDLLTPFALFEVVRALNEDATIDFIYSDRDMITEDGSRRYLPFFKPGWSPEILFSVNYLIHLCVVRRSLAAKVGGFDPRTDGAQDWDWFLRITEQTDKVAHIPKILYHWRHWGNSAASGIEAKLYALEAQKRAIEGHICRLGFEPKVSLSPDLSIRANWRLTGDTKVSIIIASSEPVYLLDSCLQALFNFTAYKNYEVLIVTAADSAQATNLYLQTFATDPKVRALAYAGPSNRAAMNNFGARYGTGSVLLFLSENLQPRAANWLEEMVQWAEQSNIGAVGARLFSVDGRTINAGWFVGAGGRLDSPAAPLASEFPVMWHSTEWYGNFLAVSGDCLMIRRATFDKLGGFNEAEPASDVELCLRSRDHGYRTVYTPFAELRQIEPQQAAAPVVTLPQAEPFRDPFYNPNLALARQDEDDPR